MVCNDLARAAPLPHACEAMNRTVLRRILRGALAAILVLAGLWLLIQIWPVKHPITLQWVGWTNQGPTRLAQLTLSNVSRTRVWINANGRGEPQIDVVQFGLREKDDQKLKYSKLTANVYMGWGMLLNLPRPSSSRSRGRTRTRTPRSASAIFPNPVTCKKSCGE
jgi:hypothetical protein